MIRLKLAVLLSPIIVLVAVLSLLPDAPIVHAQTPTPSCTPVITEPVFIFPELPTNDGWASSDVPADSEMWDWDLGVNGPWVHSTYTIYDNYYLYFEGGTGSHYAAVRLSAEDFLNRIGESGTSFPSENLYAVRWYSSESTGDPYSWFIVEYSDGSISEYQAGVGGYHYRAHEVSDKTVVAFYLWSAYVAESGYIYVADAQMYYNGCQEGDGGTCATVQDYHFTGVPTDTWLLDNADIISSIVTINSGGQVGQNLVTGTIENNTTYSAAISVTSVSGDTDLLAYLHIFSQTLTITQAGLYTATFDVTGAGEIGSSIYLLENLSDGPIQIDWTCIYEGETSTGVCFGPENGTFQNSNWWDWQDNAEHNAATLSANLLLNSSWPWAYITSTSVTTLPTLPESKYMLLEFDAVTLNNECSGGLLTIKGRQVGITSTATYTAQITNQRQTFQIDVSDFANEDVQFLFGNDGGDGAYDDDIDLDNVCVFVSDDPPTTATTDPGGVAMICNASGWFDCQDIDGILAYLGVDMSYQRAVYADGVSVWDPEGWVPWIVAAWWVMVATILCFFLVLITSIINLITYFLNNILNYINWVLTNWPLFLAWLGSWLTMFRATFYYAVEWLRLTGINWLFWFYNALLEFSEVPWYIIASLGVITAFIFGGFWWLGNLLIPVLLYLISGGNNALRGLFNYFVENGWNGLMSVLSVIVSAIIDTLIVLWNYLVPFLSAVFMALIGPVSILFYLFPPMWDFIWSIIMFIWVTIIQPLNIPLAFYTGLDQGVKSGAFSALMACDGSTGNFWCGLFTGLDLLNGVAGASVLYPIIIAAIIVGTISILYKNIVGLWHFFADIVTKI